MSYQNCVTQAPCIVFPSEPGDFHLKENQTECLIEGNFVLLIELNPPKETKPGVALAFLASKRYRANKKKMEFIFVSVFVGWFNPKLDLEE